MSEAPTMAKRAGKQLFRKKGEDLDRTWGEYEYGLFRSISLPILYITIFY